MMQLDNSKTQVVQPRTALIQGESFRCVAVEYLPSHWRCVQDGAELPPVLDIVSVMSSGQPAIR